MQPGSPLTDKAIFEDVSTMIRTALERTHSKHSGKDYLTRTAFEIALEQLN